MIANPETVETGNEVADEVITVLLSTSMFVGGTLGFLLDNTIPGKQSVWFLIFENIKEIFLTSKTTSPFLKAVLIKRAIFQNF